MAPKDCSRCHVGVSESASLVLAWVLGYGVHRRDQKTFLFDLYLGVHVFVRNENARIAQELAPA